MLRSLALALLLLGPTGSLEPVAGAAPSPDPAAAGPTEARGSLEPQGRGGKRGGKGGRGASRGGGSKPKKSGPSGRLGRGGAPKGRDAFMRGSSKNAAGRTAGAFLRPSTGRPEDREPGPQTSPAGTDAEAPRVDPITDEDIQRWYGEADHDGNGWVSFHEARASMAFSRERFRAYDQDVDGRMSADEFLRHYFESLRQAGTFEPPSPPPGQSRAPRRTPEQLRNAYDADLDGKLSAFELDRALLEYLRDDLQSDQLLENDLDLDGRLSVAELEGIPELLDPPVVTDLALERPEVRPATIDELFGQVIPRDEGFAVNPYPPLIVGPVSHFRRLDLDDDGAISVADLTGLLRPVQLRVRLGTLLNTLDLDRDGMLNEEELERALIRPIHD